MTTNAPVVELVLTVALVILIGITSAGIYGFLSSAYQQTASQNVVVEKQISALETKKQRYVDTKTSYDKEKEHLEVLLHVKKI